MFERTHAFVSAHFIRHYTVIFCQLMQKRKNSAVHWKTYYFNPISLHVTLTHCNR